MQTSNYQRALEVLSKVKLFYIGLGPYTFDGLTGEDLEEAKSAAWIEIYSEITQVLKYEVDKRVACGECRKKLLP